MTNSEQNFLPLHVATPWCKFAHLDDAFFEVFLLQASPLEGQSLQQKEKKGGKGKAKKN